MIECIDNIKDLPKGYFRIHWPQYQVLMDYDEYNNDAIFCDGDCAIEGMNTIALPYSWMDVVEKELGSKTRFYIEFINQNPDLN